MSVRAVTAMLHVGSVPRAIAFYGKLGFVVGNAHTPEGLAEPVWAWLESGDAHLMLVERGVDVGPIAYPFFSPKGEFRVRDPDGYVLMVSHT